MREQNKDILRLTLIDSVNMGGELGSDHRVTEKDIEK